jgi:signal transduction histidine kinase
LAQIRENNLARAIDANAINPLGERGMLAAQGVCSSPQDEIAALKLHIAQLERSLRDGEEQLRQSQKMEAVGELAGGIAHDFKNILTVITATLDMLTDAVADKPDLAGVVQLIEDAADRGTDLTHRLLVLSRKKQLQSRKIDVNTAVADTVRLLKPALGGLIRIRSDFADGLRPVLMDDNQFCTALLNLALNARDAMPDGGVLTLRTGLVDTAGLDTEMPPAGYIVIAVTDTGTGIPGAIRHRVLEPFFTTKETGKGTGLGLSMVHGFVTQCGGQITIDSEEGIGTTVRLYLPQA